MFAHQGKQPLARTFGIAADDTSELFVFIQIIFQFGIDFRSIDILGMGKIATGQNAGIQRIHIISGRAEVGEINRVALPENFCQAGIVQIQKFRLDRAVSIDFRGGFDTQRLEAGMKIIGNAVSFGLCRVKDIFADNDFGHGHIIKQGRQVVFIKKRQPVFHPHVFLSGGNSFIKFVFLAVRAESFAIFGAKGFDGIVVDNDFVHHLKTIAFQFAGGSLGHDVKSADFLHLIVKQINAQRLFGPDRKNFYF